MNKNHNWSDIVHEHENLFFEMNLFANEENRSLENKNRKLWIYLFGKRGVIKTAKYIYVGSDMCAYFNLIISLRFFQKATQGGQINNAIICKALSQIINEKMGLK